MAADIQVPPTFWQKLEVINELGRKQLGTENAHYQYFNQSHQVLFLYPERALRLSEEYPSHKQLAG